MSTRAAIIIKDELNTLNFYRHSDGYPKCCGEDLKEFVKDYTSGLMRLDAMQSAGWLIVRGHFEYREAVTEGPDIMHQPSTIGPRPRGDSKYDNWKVGAYEPTSSMHGDEEYIYIIDLTKRELRCRVPKAGLRDSPTLANTTALRGFKCVKF